MSSRTPSLQGARVVVVGAGKSGVAAARLLHAYGASVVVTDSAAADRLSEDARALPALGIELSVGGHHGVEFGRADQIVISPGVPSFDALEAAERAGVEVIGEVELAWRLLPHDVPQIAITGSNGKSTTVTLVGELLQALGGKPFVGGNLGEPPCDIVPRPGGASALPFDSIVLEISSFQAERVPTYAPARVALLNVSPNHLDRYRDYDAYVAAKGNLFVNQRPPAAAIVPAHEPACVEQARRGEGELLLFGAAGSGARFWYDRDVVVDELRGERYARREMRLAGDHNALNVCASLALIADRTPDPDVVRSVLASFAGLPHRITAVGSANGVTYYDDSKGTNVGATVAAVRGLAEARVVLIAGGRDKLGSYEPLVSALRDRGRALVLIGEAADRIAAAVGDAVPVERAATMEEAVARAAALAQPGDAVLLSPACSSFDMFRDYKQRGDAFVDAVAALPPG